MELSDEELYIEKKKLVWKIISENENAHYSKTMSHFPKLQNQQKSKPKTVYKKKKRGYKIINRKVIPIFIDDDNDIYERENIMHKFKVFEEERKKKFNSQKMENLFNKLFTTKNRKFKFREREPQKENLDSLKSPNTTSKKFYSSYQNNYETSEFPYISQTENNNINTIESKKTSKNIEEYDNDFGNENEDLDSFEIDEKVIKNLEDNYPFFNKDIDQIGKQRKQIQKLFRNGKVEYFHHVDKIKRAHFMDLTPASIINSNLAKTQTKFPLYKTMSKFSRTKYNFGKNYMNTTTGFNYLKKNLLNKSSKTEELNNYALKIINNLRKK